MRGLYLILLVISLLGLGVIDYRYKLAYFLDRKRTVTILLISLIIFIVWDVAGILAGIFFVGDNTLLIGLGFGEFPVEELFFLMLLNYNSLVIYTALKRRLAQ